MAFSSLAQQALPSCGAHFLEGAFRMKIYDLSVVLRPSMPVWPGDISPSRELHVSTAKGDICNVSQITYSAHTGTHVDAPFHFIPDGKTMEQVDTDRLVGPARVVE